MTWNPALPTVEFVNVANFLQSSKSKGSSLNNPRVSFYYKEDNKSQWSVHGIKVYFIAFEVEVSPLENAIQVVENKNQELRTLISQYQHKQMHGNINLLSMCLNGVIDAAVNGGIARYQEVSRALLPFLSCICISVSMTAWLNKVRNSHVHYLRMGLHPLLSHSASVLAQPRARRPRGGAGISHGNSTGNSRVSQRWHLAYLEILTWQVKQRSSFF